MEESLTRKALGDSHYLRLREREELYDLENNPNEFHNVAKDSKYISTLEDLRSRLQRWMEENEDPILRGPVPVPGRGFVQDPVPMFDDRKDNIVGKLL